MGRLSSLPSAVITDDSALGGLTIEKSLRFNGNSSHKLTRTPPSAGNRRTFTFAFWIKRSRTEDSRYIFTAHDGNDDSNHFQIFFNAGNELVVKGHSTTYKETQGTFQDVNSWYHFVVAVDTTQGTSTNRMKIYVNGKEITDLDTNTAPSQNHQFAVCAALDHNYGVNVTGDNYWWDGYMADVHLVDGLQLTPSSFGYTDFQTGTWRPKRYSGSYNTTGHYLKFTDGSALGKDYSGQGNDFTSSNLGAGDSVLDSPSNNFATYRMHGTPNNSAAEIQSGLLMITGSTGSARELQRTPISTYMMSKGSGKWYMEIYTLTGTEIMLGCGPDQIQLDVTGVNTRFIMIYGGDGNKYVKVTGSEVISTYGASYNTNSIMGFLLDMEQTTPVMYVSKNGQWANGSGSWNQSNPYTSGGAIPMTTPEMLTERTGGNENKVCFWGSSAGGGTNAQWYANFGQDSTFQNRTAAGGNKDSAGIGDFKYPVPDGALALCSNNLSRVDNTKNSECILDPRKHFEVIQYSGNNENNRFINSTSTNDITLKFKPDLLWIKRRTGGNMSWFVVDSSRSYTDSGGGNGNVGPLAFNENYVATNASTDGGFVGFENTGFKLGKGSSTSDAAAPYQRNNASGASYIAMMWKAGDSYSTNNDGTIAASVSANPEAGFSICNYTSTTGTVGHGLNSAPRMIIMKSISDSADQWTVGHYHLSYHATNGEADSWDYGLPLNSGAARQDNSAFWNDTPPTSTVFYQGSWNNAFQKVAYCWAEVPGYSQFGQYRGNSSTDGRFIYCGFRPAFVMIREFVSGDNWTIAYNGNYNPHTPKLVPNQAYAGSVASSQYLDFYCDGFKWRGTDSGVNASNKQYVYAAFAGYTGFSPYASEIPAGDYRRV